MTDDRAINGGNFEISVVGPFALPFLTRSKDFGAKGFVSLSRHETSLLEIGVRHSVTSFCMYYRGAGDGGHREHDPFQRPYIGQSYKGQGNFFLSLTDNLAFRFSFVVFLILA